MPTTELPEVASLLLPAEPRTSEEEKVGQEERADTVSRKRMEVALPDVKEIARAELARRRRRLGKLTPEQEIVIEDLLIQTVTRISKLVERVQETLPMVT